MSLAFIIGGGRERGEENSITNQTVVEEDAENRTTTAIR